LVNLFYPQIETIKCFRNTILIESYFIKIVFEVIEIVSEVIEIVSEVIEIVSEVISLK